MSRVAADPLDRLMRHVEVQADGCSRWTGAISKGGYGRTYQGSGDSKKDALAHRLMYELVVGPIPDGLQIDHLCRFRACVNPEHLEPVTNRENLLRSPLTIVQVKTHCLRGHALEGNNLGYNLAGRYCRECARGHARVSRHRKSLELAQADELGDGEPTMSEPMDDSACALCGQRLRRAARPDLIRQQWRRHWQSARHKRAREALNLPPEARRRSAMTRFQ